MNARIDERVNGRAAPERSLVGAVATADLAGGNRWELGGGDEEAMDELWMDE